MEAAAVLRSALVKNPAQEVDISKDPHGQLRDLLAEYKIGAIADTIALVTAARKQDRNKFERILKRHDWDPRIRFMPSRLRRLLTFAIADLEIDDDGADKCPPSVLADAESLMSHIDSEREQLRGKTVESVRRAKQSQTHEQLDHSYFRMDLLLKLNAMEKAAERSVDVNDAFREKFKLSYHDLVFYCFAFYALVISKPGERLQPTAMNVEKPLRMDPEQRAVFLEFCSLTYEELSERAKVKAVRPEGYEQYALSPLVRWPMLKHTDGIVTIPIATDILDRAISNFHVDIDCCLSRRQLSQFRDVWGSVFEDYVRQSLNPLQGTLLEGKDILPATRKNCDFLWQNDGADVGGYTLIEAKVASWPLRASLTQTDTELRKAFDQDGGIVDGIVQLESSSDAIRLGETDLNKSIPLTGLLVVSGERFDLNSAHLRELVKPLVRRRIGRGPKLPYHVVSQVDFYYLVQAIAGGGNLNIYLKEKYENKIDRFSSVYDTLNIYFDQMGPHPLDNEYRRKFDELLRGYGFPEESEFPI